MLNCTSVWLWGGHLRLCLRSIYSFPAALYAQLPVVQIGATCVQLLYFTIGINDGISMMVPDSTRLDHATFLIFTCEENNGLQDFFGPLLFLLRNEAGFSQSINLQNCFEGLVHARGQAQWLLLCELCSLPS